MDADIIRMAREAGLCHFYDSEGDFSGVTDASLVDADKQRNDERLVEILGPLIALVRADERERIKAEPVPGKVVAWGIFALTDGEWQLQHPVFVGDECGKENAEFERASYSGPQPLEVRPLGVVTAAAQQAEPVCPDCHGIGYDASGQLCACQQNPSF